MKLIIIIAICTCWGLQLFSQNLYDQCYMMGQYNGLVSFSHLDTVSVSYPVAWKLTPLDGLAFICDKNGGPQFYTDGGQIGNMRGDTLIATGMLDTAVQLDYEGRLPIPQGTLILPKNDCQYYCFYYSETDSLYQYYQQVNLLFYALVDMCANTGRGEVLSVRNQLHRGTMGDGRMTACRHANGRDWWLVVHGYNDNSYLKFLVTPDTITGPYIQQIGADELQPDILGQAVFSSDGTKFASITGYSPLVILDFDRCTGEFSNPVAVNVSFLPPYQISGSGALGCCFSPSGRYIYMNGYSQIVQLDLLADTIENSMTLIGQYDTTYESTNPFHLEYLAPNGKIYIDNWDAGPHCFHVINTPDSAGSSCNYDKRGLCPDNTAAYPISNMPHYRLGPLAGSACDTLNTAISNIPTERKELIKLRPNPATDKILISLTEYMKNAVMQITDVAGKVIFENRQFYLDELVDVSNWAKGEYFVKINNGDKIETAKFSKQ